MTRPPQPRDYPGDLPDGAEPQPVRQGKIAYVDALGRRLEGIVRVFAESSDVPAVVPIVGGEIELASLPSGRYKLVAEVRVDGVTRYIDSEVTL